MYIDMYIYIYIYINICSHLLSTPPPLAGAWCAPLLVPPFLPVGMVNNVFLSKSASCPPCPPVV